MSNRSKLASLLVSCSFAVAACLGDAPISEPFDSGRSMMGPGGSVGEGVGGGRGGTTGSGGNSGTGGAKTGGGGTVGAGGSTTPTGGRGAGGMGMGGTGAGIGVGGRIGTGGMGAGGMGVGGTGAGGSSVACVKPGAEYTSNNGSVTFYTLSQGSNGVVHCSYLVSGQNPDVISYVATGAGQYFAAMNTADYNGAHTCGACVEVTRDGSRKVVATVVDECPSGSNPKCVRGHIDLSQAAFTQIGNTTEGFLGTGNTLQNPRAGVGSISWRYVPCPVTGNVRARIKPGNQNEVFFENLITPIKSASVNGQTSNVLQTYNGWNFGNNNIAAGANFSVTDLDNSVITFSLPSAAQNLSQDTGKRFAACQ